ncbi:uncharacterized protein LOC124387188 isoform X2 [Silurus meridionalis]|uniref:uncharacterized protein LOC124387188 isoform X2 n=1 Tax=Silurus meridionalis TaxID=175797 RepID=UPI001EEA18C5|nr:uncharacterized protein LOC124387188 isoform X2 [Silurus meridionalis]
MLDVIGHFNNDMRNHTMLLFTRSSHLQSTGLEGYLKGSGKPIQSLVEKFEHRYHVLNDSTKNNHRKFRELMEKIEQMVQENRGQTLQLVTRKQEVGAMRQHEVDTLINSQLMQGCSKMEGCSSVGDYTFKSLRPTEKYDLPSPFEQSDVLEETGMDQIPGEEVKNKKHLEKSALQRNPPQTWGNSWDLIITYYLYRDAPNHQSFVTSAIRVSVFWRHMTLICQTVWISFTVSNKDLIGLFIISLYLFVEVLYLVYKSETASIETGDQTMNALDSGFVGSQHEPSKENQREFNSLLWQIGNDRPQVSDEEKIQCGKLENEEEMPLHSTESRDCEMEKGEDEGEAEGEEKVLRQQCQKGDDDELPQRVLKGEGKDEEELQQQCQNGKDDEFPQHIQTGEEADKEEIPQQCLKGDDDKLPQQIIGTTERVPHQSQLRKRNKITQHGCNPGGKNTPQQRKRANADHTLQNKKQDTPKQSKRHKDLKISKHVFKGVKGKPQDIKRSFKTKKHRYIFLGCRKITERGMTESYPNAADWRLIKRYNNATVLGVIKRYPSIICWMIIKRYPKATCCQMVKRYHSATFWGTTKQYPNIACWGMIKKIHQCGSLKGDKQIPQCDGKKDNEEKPQYNMMGHDKQIPQCNKYKREENRPQYTRSRDGEEVPQCIRGKDNDEIPQYKRDKNNEVIPKNNSVEHDKEISQCNRFRDDDMPNFSRLGHGKEKPQCNKYKHKENIPQFARSGDGKEVVQCNRGKYNKEILKCTRCKNNEEIPQTKKYKENEEIPQNTWPGNEKDIPQMTRDKGNNDVPQCNMDEDNEDYRQDNSLGDDNVKPQCTRCNDDEEIPIHNRRTDHKEEHQDKRKWDNADKQQKRKTAQDHEKIIRNKKHDQDDEIPQPSKKLEGKKIPKEYRKTDYEIPHYSRKGNEKETPQLTSVGDYKEIIEAPDYRKEGHQFGDSNNKTHYKRPDGSKTADNKDEAENTILTCKARTHQQSSVTSVSSSSLKYKAEDEDSRPPGEIWKPRRTKSLERLNEFKKDEDEDTGPPGGFRKLRRAKSLERFDVFKNNKDEEENMILTCKARTHQQSSVTSVSSSSLKYKVAEDKDSRPPGGIWKLRRTKSLERLNEFKKDGDEDTGPPGGFRKLRRTKSLERFEVFNRNDKKTDVIESSAFPVRPAACMLFFSHYCLIPVVLYCAFVSNVCLLMLDCTHESLKSFQGPLKGSYKDLQSASIYCKGVGKVSYMAMGKTSLLLEY